MLRRISGKQFQRWMAYYEVEPWGVYRDDLRQGMTSALIANLFLKKGKRAREPKDYVLLAKGDRRKGSAKDLLKTMSAIFPGAPKRKFKKRRKHGIHGKARR